MNGLMRSPKTAEGHLPQQNWDGDAKIKKTASNGERIMHITVSKGKKEGARGRQGKEPIFLLR